MSKKIRKTTVILMWIAVSLLTLFFSVRVYTRLTDGFSVESIRFTAPKEFQVSFDTKISNTILKQPYSYLGKGSQSFVFESEDGKYVVKFFKKKHLFPSRTLVTFLNIPFCRSCSEKKIERRREALKRVIDGYATAYEKRREECGVVFVHLDQSKVTDTLFEIHDNLGWKHLLDINEFIFVVQKKATPTKAELKKVLDSGDVALAKTCIRQVLNHYMSEYRDGVYDEDYGILSNKGFIGEKVVLIDAGKLRRSEMIKTEEYYLPHLAQNIVRLKKWLWHNYPKYSEELMREIDQWREL